MSKTTKDKDDRMTITVEKGEETISFQTSPDLHISEFRDLMMRLAAAVGYHQSNIEEYFLQNEEKGECCGASKSVPNTTSQTRKLFVISRVISLMLTWAAITMKIKVPIYWDFKTQEESEVIVNVPNAAVKEVLMDFLLQKGYENRREWLIENVPEINLNIPKELF